jgi:hypothetical protein
MRSLLDTLNESSLADERPVAALIGLAPDAGSFWEDLRIGELKTCSRWPPATRKPHARAATGFATSARSTPNAAAFTAASRAC